MSTAPRAERSAYRERLERLHHEDRTLAALHYEGIVHRDGKTGNLLVAEDGPREIVLYELATSPRTIERCLENDPRRWDSACGTGLEFDIQESIGVSSTDCHDRR